MFNQPEPPSWPLFTLVESVRPLFADGTAIMVAVGGWGDTAGFEMAAATDRTRKLFARNVKLMVDATGADGKRCVRSGVCLLMRLQVLISTGNTRG